MLISESTPTTDQEIRGGLPLIPLRDMVVFPGMIVPLIVGRSRSLSALSESLKGSDRLVVVAMQMDAEVDDPPPAGIYKVGTLARVLQILKLPDGTSRLLMEGLKRVRRKNSLPNDSFCEITYEVLEEKGAETLRLKALARSVAGIFERYLSLCPSLPEEMAEGIRDNGKPGRVADMISSHLQIPVSEKQALLETTSVGKRLMKIGEILNSEIEILQIENRITGRIRRQIDETQRHFYLTEQIKAIEEELGKGGGHHGETEEMREAVLKAGMPPDVRDKAFSELEKLSRMIPLSPESAVSRNYLDWLIALPWSKSSRERLDLERVKNVLDGNHYGLETPKKRIIESLAVRKLAGKKAKSPIICLVGPPGVGKTSLAKSVAESIGRKFARISLGGVRDEAEIRGHRRTYVGALPGKILQSMKKVKVRNPVLLLDEVDKLSRDFHGDPSSALLEVLDPEQNRAFNDHYLEVDFDFSDVLFITTANVVEFIHPTLRDRLEIIEMPGYTEWEKIEIANRFLILNLSESHGFRPGTVRFTRDALLKTVRLYTREAGIRELERQLAGIFRKHARKVVESGVREEMLVRAGDIEKDLGKPKFRWDELSERQAIGMAMGLAWTEAGGELLRVEASRMSGKGDLILTGQLGEIMQESARAAFSFLRSNAKTFDIRESELMESDIHVHVPEGSIPKDGPSAGVTIAAALYSNIAQKPIRLDVAMTGEITLRGKILPVGGGAGQNSGGPPLENLRGHSPGREPEGS